MSVNRIPFEEALTMSGFGRYNWCLFLLSSSIVIGMTFESFSVSYLVTASSCELNTTSAQQGLIACMPLIGSIATSQVWGYFADTRGRRKVVFISVLITYVIGTAAAFSPNWIVFSILKLLSSTFISGALALSLTLLSECTPAAKRSSLILLTVSVYFVSMGLMAVIAIPVLPLTFSFHVPYLGIFFNSWRVLNLIYALPCAISAVGCYFAHESPKFLVSVGKDEKALEVLKRIYTLNTGKNVDTYKIKALDLGEAHSSSIHNSIWRSMVTQTVLLVKAPFLKYTSLLSMLLAICYFTMCSWFMWLPFIINAFMITVVNGGRHMSICEMIRNTINTTMVEETNLECTIDSTAMVMVFGFAVVLAFANIFVNSILNYFGRKRLFVGIQMLAGGTALLLNLSPYWILSAVMFMIFLSATNNLGLLSSYSVDFFPTHVKAMAVCLCLTVARASAVIGVNVLKLLMATNCEAAFNIFGSIVFGGGLLGLLLPSEERLKEQKKEVKEVKEEIVT